MSTTSLELRRSRRIRRSKQQNLDDVVGSDLDCDHDTISTNIIDRRRKSNQVAKIKKENKPQLTVANDFNSTINKSIFDIDSNSVDQIIKPSNKSNTSLFDVDDYKQFGNVVLSEDSDSDVSTVAFTKHNHVSEFNFSEEQLIKEEETGVKSKDEAELNTECDNADHGHSDDNWTQNNTETELFDFSAILQKQQEVAKLTEIYAQVQKVDTKKSRTQTRSLQKKDHLECLDVRHLLSIGEKNSKCVDNVSESSISDEEEHEEKDNRTLKSVQITISESDEISNKKKNKSTINDVINGLVSSRRKGQQLLLHKAHIVCLLSSGLFMNSVANSAALMVLAMSLLQPSQKHYPPEKSTVNYLEKLLKWFNSKIKLNENTQLSKKSLMNDLVNGFNTSSACGPKILVLMFIVVARLLGVKCRLVMNCCAVPLRPPPLANSQKKSNPKKDEKSKESSDSDSSESSSERKVPSKPKLRKKSVKSTSNCEEASDSPASSKPDQKVDKTKLNSSKSVKKGQTSRGRAKSNNHSTVHKDDEKDIKNGKKRKVVSSDDEVFKQTKEMKSAASQKKTNDFWSEVYIEAEKRWIPVDIANNKINGAREIYQKCSTPVSYVMAWNSDNTVKDVTRRYVPQWHICLKSRVDAGWLNETLKPWSPANTAINREEEEELDRIISEMPLPKTIHEYKNHPLYALRRHLLKFETIYPTALPIGQVNKEDVYARACVVELHTKESWLKEGKVVKPNQEPAKIVKARPKREKGTGKLIKDIPLNLYGKWQVEDYIPPTAVDGKVPRNDFGNVEVYKPSMVPKGCVHLHLPGLMRIAKKLDIDCAHAVVGWEFRGHGSHPVMDGVIICEEYKELLVDAWNKDVENRIERNKEASCQRALANWRKFGRAILLRDKLSGKYKFQFEGVNKPTEKK